MPLDPIKALKLLSECTGDDIWSLEYCQQSGIPQQWVEKLQDCYESGFQSHSHTIYLGDQVINQYEGVRDVDIALRLGEFLGVPVQNLSSQFVSRAALVLAIQEAVEEG